MINLYFAVMYIILGIVRDCTHYWSQVLMLRVRYPPRYSCTQAGGEGRSRWPPTISPTVADVLKVSVCMLILSKPVKKMCQNYTDDLRIEPSCSSTCYPVFSFLFLWHRRMTCDGAEDIIIMPFFLFLLLGSLSFDVPLRSHQSSISQLWKLNTFIQQVCKLTSSHCLQSMIQLLSLFYRLPHRARVVAKDSSLPRL